MVGAAGTSGIVVIPMGFPSESMATSEDGVLLHSQLAVPELEAFHWPHWFHWFQASANELNHYYSIQLWIDEI